MRIALAATGLLLVVGMGGAYAVMRGQPAFRHAPNVAAKSPGIPKAESARLFLLSGVSTQPARPVIAISIWSRQPSKPEQSCHGGPRMRPCEPANT
jgi:hypothetical protein